jgi:hypothetical protein
MRMLKTGKKYANAAPLPHGPPYKRRRLWMAEALCMAHIR